MQKKAEMIKIITGCYLFFFFLLSSASTYSLSSRVLRTERSFFLCPGGGAFKVAVFAFLEQVWETGAFDKLEKRRRTSSSLCFRRLTVIPSCHQ